MSDFFQTGAIATLHRLGKLGLERMEQELMEFSNDRPIALVLPCHISELGTRGLHAIVRVLEQVPYLKQIIVGIDGATQRRDWERARAFFRHLPQNPVLLWNDGPRMKSLFRNLASNELSPGVPGKGRNVWICFGYALASEQASVVTVHDCDILTYSREFLARLCYPVTHPSFGFDFCKGYYARVSDKLNGRVMRLLMSPLISALKSLLCPHPYPVYLDPFVHSIQGAISAFKEKPPGAPLISNWNRVESALPSFLNDLGKAVQLDNAS